MTDRKLLFDNFALLAEAPGGIRQLREMVLQLAVRGELTSREPGDEPAAVLLDKIRKEKAKLEREGKIGKQKPLPPVTAAERPFELPEGWEWCRLGEIALIRGGKRLPPGHRFVDQKTPFIYIRVTNMKNGTLIDDSLKYINKDTHEILSRYIIEKEDLYITIAGTIGAVGTVPTEFHKMHLTENAARLIMRKIDLDFMKFSLNSSIAQNQFIEKTNKQAQPKLALFRIASSIIPLPPLAEQKRIVTRVDKLMGVLDTLEAKQQACEHKRTASSRAAVNRLLETTDPAGFRKNWQGINRNFAALFRTGEDVKQLRQAVLQLAVQGKLVPQNPEDEPAAVLLEKIRKEKTKIVKEGKITKRNLIFYSISEGRFFKEPNNWIWCYFDELIIWGPKNGISPKPTNHPTGIKSLTLSATTTGYFCPQYFKYLPDTTEYAPYYLLKKNDLLIQRGNSLDYVGIAAIYDGTNDEFVYPDLMMKVRCSKLMDNEYVHKFLISNFARSYFQNKATGTSGSMPKINHSTLCSLPFPLPPLAEQKRIVARVDSLMSLCDRLDAAIAKRNTVHEQLACSLLQVLR